MSPRSPNLPVPEAERFYDRMGGWLDCHAFYEDAALDWLLAHGQFGCGGIILELGCGTGRFAERLLTREMRPDARYVGLDLSAKMVELASRRLGRFGPRADLRKVSGEPIIPLPDGTAVRVVSTYVLDLLSEAHTRALLQEAARVMRPDGLLCVASLACGTRGLPRLVSRAWNALHSLRPVMVGGCRPIDPAATLESAGWAVLHRETFSKWGIPTAAAIARHAIVQS